MERLCGKLKEFVQASHFQNSFRDRDEEKVIIWKLASPGLGLLGVGTVSTAEQRQMGVVLEPFALVSVIVGDIWCTLSISFSRLLSVC